MNKTTTLSQLSLFTQNEAKELKALGLKAESQTTSEGPKKETLNFILNFSKAYSCRKSQTIGSIETHLN